MNWKGLPIPYKYAILGGFGLGVLFGFKTYLMYLYWGETENFKIERHALVPIINYTLWAFLMPLVYYFVTKYKLHKSAPLSERLKAILASIFMSLLHETTSNVIYFLPMDLLGKLDFTPETLQYILGVFPSAIINRLIEYWILYAIFTAIDYQRKFRNKQLELVQLENQLSGAQLNALRLQLQPHFLFNTLNAISSLMDIDTKRAQKMVSQLGSLLRTVLDKNKHNMVALHDELEFVKNYLNIEQVRFLDRLIIKYQIEKNVLNAQIPSLLLQPLVENAIKHGFANKTEKGTIELIVKRLHEDIQIIVRDDGQGTNKSMDFLLTTGIGLRNVNDRLKLLYNDNYQFDIKSEEGKGFELSIILPYFNQAE